MPRNFLAILILVGLSLSLALPAIAKSKKQSSATNRATPRVSLKYDSRMQAATKFVNSKARRRSQRRCWRAVKNALVRAKVVSSRPSTRYAKQAGGELQKKYAFKKLNIKNPNQAPLGAILVYGGRGAGHVEIRTQKGFVSDFTSRRPSRRPLLGVYVTPKMLAGGRGKGGASRRL